MTRNKNRLWASVVGGLLSAACVGQIVDDTSGPHGPGGKGIPGGSGVGTENTPVCAEGVCVQSSALARLTRSQYANSVQQLLGATTKVDTARLPQDHAAAEIFSSNESVPPSADDVDRYSAVAEDLAANVDLAPLLSCKVADGDTNCARDLITTLGEAAYRRALTPEEVTAYVEMYDGARGEGDDFEDASRLVIATVLQSPNFLYLIEPGGDSAPRKLDGRAVAVRLSYFLWREGPAPSLLAAADAGELDTAEGVEAKAREMLDDPKFDRALREFFSEWLALDQLNGLGRDPAQFPKFTESLATSMREETERFAVHVFRNDGARQEALLSANYSVINPELADLYGVSPAKASGFAVAQLTNRAGLLTHASVLTTHATEGFTTPIFRGIFVRTRLLCHSLAPRPANVDEAIAEIEKNLSPDMDDRARLTALTGQGECAGCHTLTNKIGFGFEHFDAIGSFRNEDYAGASVDPSATIEPIAEEYATDVDGNYSEAMEMTRALSTSKSVGQCLTLQWMRYALGREARGEVSSMDDSFTAYSAANLDLRELVVAITGSDAFRHRVTPPAGL
jgi:hypothetical protein